MKVILVFCIFIMAAHAQNPIGTKISHATLIYKQLQKLDEELITSFSTQFKSCLHTCAAGINMKDAPVRPDPGPGPR